MGGILYVKIEKRNFYAIDYSLHGGPDGRKKTKIEKNNVDFPIFGNGDPVVSQLENKGLRGYKK